MELPSAGNILITNNLLFKKRVAINDKSKNKIIEYDILDMEIKKILLFAKCNTFEGKVNSIEIYDPIYDPLSQNILAFINPLQGVPIRYNIVINNNDVGYIKQNGYSWEYYTSESLLYAYAILQRESHLLKDFIYFLFDTMSYHSKDLIFEFYKDNSNHSDPTPTNLGYYFGYTANLDMTLDKECYLNRYIFILLGLICDIILNERHD